MNRQQLSGVRVDTQPERIPVWKRQNSTLPKWMTEYFDWHKQERSQITRENWNKTRYAIVTCREQDRRCGGASDRLQSLPWDIYIAARSCRLLLYHWERPCKLEEFLVPNDIDWTTPDWLWSNIENGKPEPMKLGKSTNSLFPAKKYKDTTMLLQLQSSDHGALVYNANMPGEPSFYEVFKDAWESFFKPSAPVQKLIDENMQSLGLEPRQYVAAHLRQKYHKDKTSDTWNVENQVKCTYRQLPNVPIYFASDSQEATSHAVEFGKTAPTNERTVRVVARTNSTEPLHLDRGSDYLYNNDSWKTTKPSQYYDVFVDLYLLAQAKCVVYGLGGYGQWASTFTSGECYSYRQHRGKICNWDDAPFVPDSNATATS